MAHAELLSRESATQDDPQPFVIAGREFRSRLMVGTGKYSSNAKMIQAIDLDTVDLMEIESPTDPARRLRVAFPISSATGT